VEVSSRTESIPSLYEINELVSVILMFLTETANGYTERINRVPKKGTIRAVTSES